MTNDSVHRLQALVESVPSRLSAISEDEYSHRENANAWSKKQILGHLIDSAANNHQRFIRAQYEDAPSVTYDQDKWNELSHYQLLDSNHIIQLWTMYNRHLYEILKRIPDDSLVRVCNVGNGHNVTLQWLIDDYIDHMEHHLKQILPVEM